MFEISKSYRGFKDNEKRAKKERRSETEFEECIHKTGFWRIKYLAIDDVVLDGRLQGQVLEGGGRKHAPHVNELLERDQLALHDLLELFGSHKVLLQVVAAVHGRARRRRRQRRRRQRRG